MTKLMKCKISREVQDEKPINFKDGFFDLEKVTYAVKFNTNQTFLSMDNGEAIIVDKTFNDIQSKLEKIEKLDK